MSAFIIESGLGITVPVIRITYSGFSSGSWKVFFEGSIVSWVIPYLSLRSIKTIPPKFLILLIQPANCTCWLRFALFKAQQVWERYILIDKKIKNPIFSFFQRKINIKKIRKIPHFSRLRFGFFKQRVDSSQGRFEKGVQLSAQDLTFLTPHKQNILSSGFNFWDLKY